MKNGFCHCRSVNRRVTVSLQAYFARAVESWEWEVESWASDMYVNFKLILHLEILMFRKNLAWNTILYVLYFKVRFLSTFEYKEIVKFIKLLKWSNHGTLTLTLID